MRIPLSVHRLGLAVLLAVALTGCLKTRAQLRDDEPDHGSGPVPVRVQPPTDVQPQGSYMIDELKSEMTRQNGRIEDLERAQRQGSDQTAQTMRAEMQKLETRLIELETAQKEMLERMKVEQAVATANPDELYARGKQEFDAGNFEGAVESFGNYLKNAKAKNTESATFMRAEAYFNLKQYKKAIVDYSKFPERFQKSRHMPTVLYKTGMSFEGLGLRDDAKSFYQELIEKFPKSAEAKRARSKIK